MTLRTLLSEGSPRSLGRTNDVVSLVLKHPDRVAELFECVFDDDEIIRMRAGDALEKVCNQKPEYLQPYTERVLSDVSLIDQPSVQWHVAQMFTELLLTTEQQERAIKTLLDYLRMTQDWIVVHYTLDGLAYFSRTHADLKRDLKPILQDYAQHDSRPSVRKRAERLLSTLYDQTP